MMPSWQELNAYADGELEAARAAEIAALAADEPVLARRIAQLMKLKAGVRAAQGAAPSGISGRISLSPRPRAVRRGLLAASLALFAVAAGVLFQAQDWADPAPGWLRAAQAQHAAFVTREPVPSIVPAASLAFEGRLVLLPDLAPGELTLAGVDDFSFGLSGRGLAAHYRGNRGCQLTLVILPDAPEAFPDAPAPPHGAGGQALVWRSGGAGYLLLGSGMDRTRFEFLAVKIHDAARELRPFAPEERLALAESRRTAPPCNA